MNLLQTAKVFKRLGYSKNSLEQLQHNINNFSILYIYSQDSWYLSKILNLWLPFKFYRIVFFKSYHFLKQKLKKTENFRFLTKIISRMWVKKKQYLLHIAKI